MWRNGRKINQQGSSAHFLSVLLWLGGHKAISLWRIIMPITMAEKQTVPSLCWHQDEEFATWRLAQKLQVMDDFHLYRGSAETHQKLNPVCLLCVCVCVCVCVCLILCNTWIGPKADVGEHVGPCPTLLAWFGETVSRPIKIVTALFHKAWHVYMWFRITDRFKLVSVRTKEAGSNLAFGAQKEYQSLFFAESLNLLTILQAFEPPVSFFHFFPCDYYSSVTCWTVCNEIQMEKGLAPGPEPPCSLSPLGGSSLR